MADRWHEVAQRIFGVNTRFQRMSWIMSIFRFRYIYIYILSICQNIVEEILQNNRTLTRLCDIPPPTFDVLRAAESNWRLLSFGLYDRSFPDLKSIEQRNAGLLWKKFRSRLLDLCIAMSPLQVSILIVLFSHFYSFYFVSYHLTC